MKTMFDISYESSYKEEDFAKTSSYKLNTFTLGLVLHIILILNFPIQLI